MVQTEFDVSDQIDCSLNRGSKPIAGSDSRGHLDPTPEPTTDFDYGLIWTSNLDKSAAVRAVNYDDVGIRQIACQLDHLT